MTHVIFEPVPSHTEVPKGLYLIRGPWGRIPQGKHVRRERSQHAHQPRMKRPLGYKPETGPSADEWIGGRRPFVLFKERTDKGNHGGRPYTTESPGYAYGSTPQQKLKSREGTPYNPNEGFEGCDAIYLARGYRSRLY